MQYESGEIIRTGDVVILHGMSGYVVFCIETNDYSDDYPEAHWSYLGEGIGILTEEAGLIHIQSHEDLVLVRHAISRT